MNKTDKELATEILIAAIAAGIVKSTSMTAGGQGGDVESAFKKIFEGVSQAVPANGGGIRKTRARR